MSFNPEKIKREHILKAVQEIDKGEIELRPSTKYDAIINGKSYPPKDLMRLAHQYANGEYEWHLSGGEPTNRYIKALGFDITEKNETHENLTNNIWKLGCNWGSGKPSFYNFINEKGIVIGVNDKMYSVGDLIVITEGHQVKAIARIFETPESVTVNSSLKKSFERYEIEYESWVNYAKADWYELDEDDKFIYELQQGICKVQNVEVRKRVIDLWNNRNSSCWIFQCNPDAFDLESAIRNNLLDTWTVSAHKDKIKVGDKIILWVTGKNSGCYALAEINKEPQIFNDSKDSKLWKVEDKNPVKAGIKITHNLMDNPLLWSKIKSTIGLENLKVGRQGTNFSATKEEYKTIQGLIKDVTEIKKIEDMQAKNIILYGPPGTGKTYHSIDKAVEIANGKSTLNHSENKIQFDEFRKQGRIEFVTFHQNYSYEDFMVGIRPNVNETQNLSFIKYYGTFYQLNQRARENYFASLEQEGKLISIEVLIDSLLERLRNGDVIELKTSTNISFSIEYLSEYTIQLIYSNGSKKNTLSVDTLREIVDNKRDYPSSLKSYYYPLKEYLLKDRVDTKVKKEELKKYVLVIDEINRANISKVFGELITLLEDDKRLGEENELKITLPNGEKEFGVPPNLFIIGTMNTADKSIALIDIALRRRFEFIGKYPDYTNLNHDESSLLQKINAAIFEKKKSADYLIGHAYFMKKQSIEIVLQNKVVPLLMEYFSGKTEIVISIFEETDWNVNYDSTLFKWTISKK